MVLSDRLGAGAPPSLLKKTLIYVLGFTIGAIALITVLGLVLTSVADGVLPKPKAAATKPDAKSKADAKGEARADDEEGTDTKPSPRFGKPAFTAGSKARPPRGNDAADDAEAEDQPL
jgi:hypothetical protein